MQENTIEPVRVDRGAYYCPVCGYGYADERTAEDCRDYCNAHSSCSLEITRKAIRKP
jgi:hypothetical protein